MSYLVHDRLLNTPAFVVVWAFSSRHAVDAAALGGALLVALLLEDVMILDTWDNQTRSSVSQALSQRAVV